MNKEFNYKNIDQTVWVSSASRFELSDFFQLNIHKADSQKGSAFLFDGNLKFEYESRY